MPLRYCPKPLGTRLRLFHSSAVRRAGPKPNHYEVLQIPTNATPAEVKKSFYSLSKSHHPDRNPDDPTASDRFVAINDAYHVLGTPSDRQKYDRDVLQLHQPSAGSHGHTHIPRGSYSSSGPGGRPATGLSRRRTQFRGPPPSFYKSGGWGEHSAKRRAAQDSGAPGAEAPSDDLGGVGGMGPGQSPFGHAAENEIPHFDKESHTRTHENQAKRWQRRKGMHREDWVPAGEVPTSMFTNFILVSAIIALGASVPSFIVSKMSTAGTARKKDTYE